MKRSKTIWLLAGLLALAACNENKTGTPDGPGKDSTQVKPKDTVDLEKAHDMKLVPNKDRYFYGPDTSVITGKISVEMFYGPPGYGENPSEDAQEETYLLWLARPVKVFSNSQEQEEEGFDVTRQEVDKIQVYSSSGKFEFKTLEGKTVQVRGALFGAHTRHHHADVLMDVIELTGVK